MDKVYNASIGKNPLFSNLYREITNDDIFGVNAKHTFIISDDDVKNSGYCERPAIENQLLNYFASAKDISCLILSGSEGCGKSTLFNYTMGHLINFNKDPRCAAPRLMRINCGEWVTASSLMGRFHSELRDCLGTPEFIDIRNGYEKFQIYAETKGLIIPTLKSISSDKEYVDRLLSYSMCACQSGVQFGSICLVLDNLDTVDFAKQLLVFRDVHDTIHTARRHLNNYKPISPMGICKYLSIVLPLRPETRKIISDAMGQIWPFNGRTYYLVDMSMTTHPNSFDLALTRIKNNNLFSDANLDAIRLSIKGVYESGGRYQPDRQFELTINEPRDFIENFILWLKRQTISNDHVARFTGRSIRRQLQFSFKVIGHHSALQAYADGLYMGMPSHEIEPRIWDAMWDFCQPIGHGSPVDFSSFMLNPYKVITDKLVRDRSPLIGLYAMQLIKEKSRTGANNVQYLDINAYDIVNFLRAMCYDDDAITLTIRAFTSAGILVPRKDVVFNDEAGNNLDIYAHYFLDKNLFLEYYKIAFFKSKNKWKVGIYYTHCYRDAKSYVDHVQYYSQVERLEIQASFLSDIINAEKRLKSNMTNSRSPSYCQGLNRKSLVHQIGPTWNTQMQTHAADLSERVSVDMEERLKSLRTKLSQLKRELDTFSVALFPAKLSPPPSGRSLPPPGR